MKDAGNGKAGAWLFLAAVVAGTAALAVVAVRAPQVDDQMAFLPARPEIAEFVRINGRYGNFNTVIIGMETSDILEPENLAKVRDVTEAVGKVAGVSWVSSIGNVLDMQPSEEGVNVAPLVAEIPKDAAAKAAMKAQMLKARQVVGQMVSPDFTSALIVVTMYADKTAEVYPRIERIARQAEGGDMKVFLHGAPAISSFLAAGAGSLTPYGVAAGIAFVVLVAIGFRPLRRVVPWLLVVAPAAAAGMAAPVLARVPASGLSMASALAAFVYGTLAAFSWPGTPASDAERSRYGWWRRALLLGSLALAAVFIALVKSTVGPLQGLGVGLAAAVVVVGLLGPYALAAGTRLVGGGVPQGESAGRGFRPWAVLLALVPAALSVALIVHSPRPRASNDPSEMFDADAAPVRAVRFLERRFGGSDYLTVVADGSLEQPGFLRAMDDVGAGLRAVPGIADVVSPSDIIKMINEAMIGQYRIPDTVGQMQSLWFFLDGQPELSALLYKREQGLLQVRLAPETAGRSAEVLASVREVLDQAPARIGVIDLRNAGDAAAARLRVHQLVTAVGAVCDLAGAIPHEGAVAARIAGVLGSAVPLELKPVSESPDAAVQAAFRERLDAAVGPVVAGYLSGPGAPVEIPPDRVPGVAAAVTGGDPSRGEAGRQAATRILQELFPDDAAAMAKLAGSLMDKAAAVQDTVLVRLVVDELKGAGVADGEKLATSPELRAAMRDFASPYVVVDADRDGAKPESVAEASFSLTGFPAIAPVIAGETFADLARWGIHAVAAALLLAVVGAAAGRRRAGLAVLGAVMVASCALAFQVGWLRLGNWALDVSTFIPVAAGLCAAVGTWLIATAGGRGGRELLLAVMVVAVPLLVMAAASFAPVRTMMGLCGVGIVGAALAAWVARVDVVDAGGKKEEGR